MPNFRIVKGNGRRDLGLDDELKWELDSAGNRVIGASNVRDREVDDMDDEIPF
jgi:hypothetical protein